jgi:hypothetical protein
MKTKTAYRERIIPVAETSTPDIPERVSPSERVHIDFATDKAEPAVAVVSADELPLDEATLALQKQLADLKKSEALQREYAERMARQHTQPPTREQKLAMWQQQGMTEDDARFLSENPQMVDLHDVTRVASEEAAQQGHERGTEAHRKATKAIFDEHLGHQQAQPAASVEPTPAFFEPPEASRSPAAPDRAALYSAPVSRGTPSGGTGQRPARQITLTPQDQEYARIAGVSDVEYAKQKQRLAQHKANGDYTGRE